MLGILNIDGKDAFSEWKVSLSEGSYGQVVCMPSMKNVDTNDWFESDGVEADLSSPVSAERRFVLDFFCTGEFSDIERFFEYLKTPFVDEEGTSHGVYHTFEFLELGGASIDARMSDFTGVSIGALRSPMFFNISLYDDKGYVYDSSISTPSASADNGNDLSIDGIPFSDFGVKILEGTIDGIVGSNGVKDGLMVNLQDEAGLIYDRSAGQKKRSKNIVLKCHMKALSLDSLLSSYNSLKNLLFKPGCRTLSVPVLSHSYECCYSSCSVTGFYPLDRWLDFDLTFKILAWL